MKIKTLFSLLSVAILLYACSGSDSYRGDWKATNMQGDKFQINFEAKKLTITDSLSKNKNYDYKQNSVKIENSVSTYGIQLNDGRSLQVHFPIGNNDKIALILDANGYVIYTMSRENYMLYTDVYEL